MTLQTTWEKIQKNFTFDSLLPTEKQVGYIHQQLDYIREKSFDNIVVVGMGAATSNIEALLSSINKYTYPVDFLSTIDPHVVEEITAKINTKTLILIISKSGNTYETNIITKNLAPKFSNNIYVICPNGANQLRQISCQYNLKQILYPEFISGRFAPISIAALLPSALVGVDIISIVTSAHNYLKRITDNPEEIISQAENLSHTGRNIFILMYYNSQFSGLCSWWKQLIAESLGKSNFGITPIVSNGLIDQHSQLQLFCQGPKDKIFQILNVVNAAKTTNTISQELSAMSYNASYNTFLTLKKQSPSQYIEYPNINEKVVVEFCLKWMITTILVAANNNINPFNQPAVDSIKNTESAFFTMKGE